MLATGAVGALLAFIVVAVICVAVLRPLARRHIRLPAISRTGTATLPEGLRRSEAGALPER
jgi:hypothetical protein